MKLLTAIKKAYKKAEQSHGAIRCFVNRKYGMDFCWIEVDLHGTRIDGEFEIDDLIANDWKIEVDVV